MYASTGIILLDGNEIIVKLPNQPLSARDLTPFTARQAVVTHEIVEVLAEILLANTAHDITRWHIYARGIEDKVCEEISQAIKYPVVPLTLRREQELLCHSLLTA